MGINCEFGYPLRDLIVPRGFIFSIMASSGCWPPKSIITLVRSGSMNRRPSCITVS